MTHPTPLRPNGKLRRHRTKSFEHTINGLLTKRTHVLEELKAAQIKLETVEGDLAAIDRTLKLVGYTDDPEAVMPTRKNRRLFKKGETLKAALSVLGASDTELTSREISLKLIGDRGLDKSDNDLLKQITSRVYTALKKEAELGRLDAIRKSGHPVSWKLVTQNLK